MAGSPCHPAVARGKRAGRIHFSPNPAKVEWAELRVYLCCSDEYLRVGPACESVQGRWLTRRWNENCETGSGLHEDSP
jgi:hypothetical protein